MPSNINIRQAHPVERPLIKALLQNNHLPYQDLEASSVALLIAETEGVIIGAIGYQAYDDIALLRSLVVDENYRGQSIADTLLNYLLNEGRQKGILSWYLLTDTAAQYFIRKGFVPIERAKVPECIKQTSEFSEICSASAVVMCKKPVNDLDFCND